MLTPAQLQQFQTAAASQGISAGNNPLGEISNPSSSASPNVDLSDPTNFQNWLNQVSGKTPPTPTVTQKLNPTGITPSSLFHPASVTQPQQQNLVANLKQPVNALTPNAINDVTDIHRANVVSQQNMATSKQANQVIQGYKAQIMQLQGSTDPTAQSQISQLQDAIKTTAQHAIDAQAPYTPSTDRSLSLTPEQIAGDSIGLGLDVGGALEGGSALTSLAAPAVDAAVGTTDAVVQGSRAAQIAKAGAQGAVAGGSYGAAQGTAQGLSNNENAGGVIGSGLIGGAIGTATGGTLGAGIEAAPELTQGAKNLYSNAKSAFTGSTEKVGGQTSQNLFDTLKDKVTNELQGKTRDEIINTPDDKLTSLTDKQRTIYFQNQAEQLQSAHDAEMQALSQKSDQTEAQIKSESDQKIATIQQNNQQLENEVATASVKEAQSLKPVLIQSMRDNSDIYRGLVDKEIGQYENVPVKADELRTFIQTRFADDPTRADAIIERLGLNEKFTPDKMVTDEQGNQTLQLAETKNAPDTTVGKIYENTKALKQEIGSAARKGSRTFTPDEKLTDDAISTLSSYLKSKGVDLSEANKFWSQYAPLRDKLVSTIQPFKPVGAETGTFNTFAKGIVKAVKGNDPYNANFISETEKLLGVKIGNPETRAALENLTQGQKEEVLAKAEQEAKLQEQKTSEQNSKNQEKQNLSQKKTALESKQIDIENKLRFRKLVVGALKYVIGPGIGFDILRKL